MNRENQTVVGYHSDCVEIQEEAGDVLVVHLATLWKKE